MCNGAGSFVTLINFLLFLGLMTQNEIGKLTSEFLINICYWYVSESVFYLTGFWNDLYHKLDRDQRKRDVYFYL